MTLFNSLINEETSKMLQPLWEITENLKNLLAYFLLFFLLSLWLSIIVEHKWSCLVWCDSLPPLRCHCWFCSNHSVCSESEEGRRGSGSWCYSSSDAVLLQSSVWMGHNGSSSEDHSAPCKPDSKRKHLSKENGGLAPSEKRFWSMFLNRSSGSRSVFCRGGCLCESKV